MLPDPTQPSYYRLADIHKMLDPTGTSLKSVEELVADLQADRDHCREVIEAAYREAVVGTLDSVKYVIRQLDSEFAR